MLDLALLMLAQLGAGGGLLTPQRDVLIVVADDVGYADLEAVPTPHLDALAAQGMTFERAYANPVCSLTRRALLFGRNWLDSRGTYCQPADPYTPGPLPSLAHLARSLGFRTGLFGKWHVGSNPDGAYELAPQYHGFDVWRAGVTTNSLERRCGGFRTYFDWRRVDDGLVTDSTEYLDAAITDEFLAWWRATRGPRFAIVSFQLAHELFHEPPANLLPPGTPPATTGRGLYEHMIQALDTLAGRVLSVAGPEDLVFFLGDNGTPQGVAPRFTRAKGTTYERGIHIPFLVRAPFVKPGERSDSLVHVTDVYATLSALGGRKAAGHGVSLLPVLLDPGRRVRRSVLCGLQTFDLPRHVGGPAPYWDICLRSERYKLRIDEELEERFYDLVRDPEEDAPLDLSDPAIQRELDWHRTRLAQAMADL